VLLHGLGLVEVWRLWLEEVGALCAEIGGVGGNWQVCGRSVVAHVSWRL
jgi:hypothetical protein